ncbi:MAG: hypothetical protein HY925_01315 [Elusimicrobia bacterium]|nr:hypothetical protein [Elusimicrobiota bacterium]
MVLAAFLAAVVAAQAPYLTAPQPRFRGFEGPLLFHASPPVAAPLAEIRLPELLDRNRKVVALDLGGKCAPWFAGLGYDSSYRERFLLLSCGKRLTARRFVEGDSLLRGIFVEPAPGEVFRLKFHLRLPRLFSDSFLSLEPVLHDGKAARLRLEELLGRTAEAGQSFSVGGREFRVFYVTDIDVKTSAPGETRTVLIVERRGLRSTAWPVPESSLPAGKPVQAKLGSLEVTFVRTTDGTLFVYRPASVSSSSADAASR